MVFILKDAICVTVRKNNVGNFESATYENDRGIWIAAGTINATVEKNRVHDLNSTSIQRHYWKWLVMVLLFPQVQLFVIIL